VSLFIIISVAENTEVKQTLKEKQATHIREVLSVLTKDNVGMRLLNERYTLLAFVCY
jgi:hypothetical protein